MGKDKGEVVMSDLTEEQMRAKLSEALRSGKYMQGKNLLNSNDFLCCLGVACEISGIDEWEVRRSVGYYLGESTILPDQVASLFGISNDGSFCYDETMPHAQKLIKHLGMNESLDSINITTLTELNDVANLSFEEIADVIDWVPEWV